MTPGETDTREPSFRSKCPSLSLIVWPIVAICVSQASPSLGQTAATRVDSRAVGAEGAEGAAAVARRHFEQGVALFQEEAYEPALAEFRASYDARPVPRVLYNIGVVERALRRYADAADTLRRYLSESEGANEPPERQEAVRAILVELESLLGAVWFSSDPGGADLFVDGELRGSTPMPEYLRLEAGEHEVELRLDGYHTHRMNLEVRSRAVEQQRIELRPLPRTPVYRRWWFWTTVGVIVAGAVVASVVPPLTVDPDEAEFGRIQIVTE